ncbi:MAG: hypothetical protein IPH07_04070 [Deltaproteobacteria bacterium]|nr:hypothetical protein [Deltaproteobacteria bacterium]MBK8237823.1 hypothetical protein [Deltaproteobacteria bacterium]MBK8720491.1 hypothetical protein [Deltaproteobacteria bacterium]MBP7289759.1 hypothetical protein [Nannocystaceae bacterium]
MLCGTLSSELQSLHGWVTPYALMKDAVILAARSLAGSVKLALLKSGPALPIRVRFGEDAPADAEESTTRRILVRPEDDEHVSVELLEPGTDEVAAQRSIPWDDGRERPEALIHAIRELAGL